MFEPCSGQTDTMVVSLSVFGRGPIFCHRESFQVQFWSLKMSVFFQIFKCDLLQSWTVRIWTGGPQLVSCQVFAGIVIRRRIVPFACARLTVTWIHCHRSFMKLFRTRSAAVVDTSICKAHNVSIRAESEAPMSAKNSFVSSRYIPDRYPYCNISTEIYD